MTLTATSAAGYVFSGWSGHTDGISNLNQNPVTFQMGDRTDNNRVVNFPGESRLIGRFVEVDITAALPHSLRGAVAGDD